MKPINSSKNKLNGEIILIFHLNPNAHLIYDKNLKRGGGVWIGHGERRQMKPYPISPLMIF